jgi:hypothetical protein
MEHGRRVTYEDILAGFQSLHDAISNGFASIDRRFGSMQADIDRRFDVMQAGIDRRFDRWTKNSTPSIAGSTRWTCVSTRWTFASRALKPRSRHTIAGSVS